MAPAALWGSLFGSFLAREGSAVSVREERTVARQQIPHLIVKGRLAPAELKFYMGGGEGGKSASDSAKMLCSTHV